MNDPRVDFLATAAHELRTPLTALLLQLAALQRICEVGKQQDRAARALRQAKRLSHLIDTMMDVAKLDTQGVKLVRADMDLKLLLQDIVGQFELEVLSKCGSIILLTIADETLLGCWDRTKISQVLTNLVSNAIKYGANSKIEVAARQDGTNAIVSVTDHGVGIAPEDLDVVFDRFKRVGDQSLSDGFGLGLCITKEIVVAHGGTISVTSSAESGTIFTVSLPMA